jgi:nucleoid DNA-binding protein
MTKTATKPEVKIAVKPEAISLTELTASFAATNNLSKAAAKPMLDGLRDDLVQALLDGKRITIFGLGIFEVRATKAKTGRNPATGAVLQIPAGRKVVFKPAKGLKDQM